MKTKNISKIITLLMLSTLTSCGSTTKEQTTPTETTTSTSIEEDLGELSLLAPHGECELYIGETLKLNASFSSGKTGEVNFTSSNNEIATIDNEGVVTPLTDGVVTMTASYKDQSSSYTFLVRNKVPNASVNTNWKDLGYLNSENQEGFSNIKVLMLRTPSLLKYAFASTSGEWFDETAEVFFDVGKDTAKAVAGVGIDTINENVYRLNVSAFGEDGWYTIKQYSSVTNDFVDYQFDDSAFTFEKINDAISVTIDMGKMFSSKMKANDIFGMALGHFSNVNEQYYNWSYLDYEIPTNRAAAFVRVDCLGNTFLAPSNYSNIGLDNWLTNSYCRVNGEKAGLAWNCDAIYLNNSFILRWTNLDNGWPEFSGYGYRLTIQWFDASTPGEWMNFGIMFPGALGDSWFMGDVVLYGRIGLNSYEWEIPYSLVGGFVNVHPFIKITDPTNWTEEGVIAERVEDVYKQSHLAQKDIYLSSGATGNISFLADGNKGTPLFLVEGDSVSISTNGTTKQEQVIDTGFYAIKGVTNGKIRFIEIEDSLDKLMAIVNIIDAMDVNNLSDIQKQTLTALNNVLESETDLKLSLFNVDVNFQNTHINAYAKLALLKNNL